MVVNSNSNKMLPFLKQVFPTQKLKGQKTQFTSEKVTIPIKWTEICTHMYDIIEVFNIRSLGLNEFLHY